MDVLSIDQVVQSSNENSEYNRNNRSNNNSLHENGSISSSQSAYTAAMKRKTSMLISRQQTPSISSSVSTVTNGRPKTATRGGFTDFFSNDVFQMVLRNPATSYRFKIFCQKRACGEGMEFLTEIDNYNRILDELTKSMSNIQHKFTGPSAEKRVDISSQDSRDIQTSIKHSITNVIPGLEYIFMDAQERVESVLLKEAYPRFVKHQITTSATMALGTDKNHVGAYQGVGDCFCMTDPTKHDNPIVFASDGFVEVTGYARQELVLRNCRFLQGQLTDKSSTKRLKISIDSAEEIVELLLNYRKNGEPFWNLLYVSPLLDHNGKAAFYLGGQINCSTTINSHTDILRILGLPEDDDDRPNCELKPACLQPNGLHRVASSKSAVLSKARSTFFKSWPNWRNGSGSEKLKVMDEPGLERKLLDKFQKMDLGPGGQVEAFYTAYSKYLVLSISSQTSDLFIKFYSPSMFEFLLLPQATQQAQNSNPLSRNQGPSSLSLTDRDIFKVLADQPLSASIGKSFKSTVRDAVKNGKAVSIEMGMMTGIEETKKAKRVEEMYVTHWTVLKDENGKGKWVVLTIAPK